MKRKHIFTFVLALVALCALAMPALAAITKRSISWQIYNSPNSSLPGSIVVGRMTLYAEGDAALRKIYNCYETHSTALGGWFSDTKTWVAHFSTFDKAMCTSTYNFGLPTPWGPVGYTKGFVLAIQY